MSDLLTQFLSWLARGTGTLLWLGFAWAWLQFLRLAFPFFWPDYLRQKLQARLGSRLEEFGHIVQPYLGEHWAMLKTQIPPANDGLAVTALAHLAMRTQFQIPAWGSSWRVYVASPSLQAHSRPREGTNYLVDDEMETRLRSVFDLVARQRAEQDRLQRLAAHEAKLDRQRRDWAATEARAAQEIEARTRASADAILRKLKDQRVALQSQTDHLRDLTGRLATADADIADLKARLASSAAETAPLLHALHNLETAIVADVAGFVDAGSAKHQDWRRLQTGYAQKSGELAGMKNRVDTILGERAAAFRRRTDLRQASEAKLAEARAYGRPLQDGFNSLRAVVAAMEDDKAVAREWQRLEAQNKSAGNRWPETQALLRSLAAWHLMEKASSPAKKCEISRIDIAGRTLKAECEKELAFLQTFTVPSAIPGEESRS